MLFSSTWSKQRRPACRCAPWLHATRDVPLQRLQIADVLQGEYLLIQVQPSTLGQIPHALDFSAPGIGPLHHAPHRRHHCSLSLPFHRLLLLSVASERTFKCPPLPASTVAVGAASGIQYAPGPLHGRGASGTTTGTSGGTTERALPACGTIAPCSVWLQPPLGRRRLRWLIRCRFSPSCSGAIGGNVA
jgi:hypothetical protein